MLWYLPNLFYSAPKDAAVVEAIVSDDHPTVKPPFSIFDHLEDGSDYSDINFSDHEKLHIYFSRNETAGPSAIVGKEPDLEKLLPEVDVIELHEPAQIAEQDAEALSTELHVSGKLKLASSYGDDYSLQYLWIPAFQEVLILKVRGITASISIYQTVHPCRPGLVSML